jgi:hypothetical protein
MQIETLIQGRPKVYSGGRLEGAMVSWKFLLGG